MKMYKKGDKVIRATEKAFRVLYREQGYKHCDEEQTDITDETEVPFADEIEENEKKEEEVDLENLTNDEIKELLDEAGIEYGNRDKKAELISKYKAGA